MPGRISPEPRVRVRKCSHGGVIKSRFCASEKNANTLSRDCGNQSCEWKFRTRIESNRFRGICSCFESAKAMIAIPTHLNMDSSPPYPPYPPYPPVVICCWHDGATYAPQPQQAVRARLATLNPTHFVALTSVFQQIASAVDIRIAQLEAERTRLADQKSKLSTLLTEFAKPSALEHLRKTK